MMKIAVIVLLAFVAMASAQGVQVAKGLFSRRYTDPSKVHIVDHNSDQGFDNVDPGFSQPHGGLDNVDPGFGRPHSQYPGGYQQPNADPEFVRNPDGSLHYANQYQQYHPDPDARGK